MSLRLAAQSAFKLALSMTLFFWLALWMNWPNTTDGAMAIALVSLATTGATINKGLMRVMGLGVGALFGLVLVAAFPQERWGFLVAMSLYLAFVAYFVQLSQRKYAWMMMAMGALFTWVASYKMAPLAFAPAFDKFAVTATGVLIHSLVSMALWPKTAGESLSKQGQDHIHDLNKLLSLVRSKGSTSAEAMGLSAQLAGSLPGVLVGIQEASLDSSTVAQHKKGWQLAGVQLRALTDAMQFWLPSMGLTSALDLDRHYPGMDDDLDKLAARLEACTHAWTTKSGAGPDPETPGELAEPLTVEAHEVEALPPADLARIMYLLRQMKALERAILALQRSLLSLGQPTCAEDLESPIDLTAHYSPALWDPERLLRAMMAPLCFVTAFLFWVYMANPPGGNAVPMLAGVFGVLFVMAPMNLIGLLVYLILSAFAILPIYLWLMPILPQGGGSILGLIFFFTFGVAMLGAKSPALQLGPLLMFFAVAGIKNQQSYSFMAFLSVASMLLLVGVIVTTVHGFVNATRPEMVLRRSVSRFFRGCSLILNGSNPDKFASDEFEDRLRKRHYDAMLRSAPMQIGIAAKGLDYSTYTGSSPEKVQSLLQCLQALSTRIQALDLARHDARTFSPEITQVLTPFRRAFRLDLIGVFDRWRAFDTAKRTDEEVQELRRTTNALTEELHTLVKSNSDEEWFAESLANAYAMLGNAQLLLEAMNGTSDALDDIDWNQMALARF